MTHSDDPAMTRPQVAALSRVTTALNSALELEQVLDISVRSSIELTGLSSGVIYFADERTKQLVGKSDRGFAHGLSPGIDVHELHTSRTLAGRAFRSSDPVTFNARDPRTGYASLAPGERRAVVREGIKSAVAAQLSSTRRTYGCLVLCSTDPSHSVSPEDIALTQVIAGQVAVAIERAQLYEDTKQRAAESEALYLFGQKLAARNAVEEALQEIVDRVRRQFGARSCRVGVRQEDGSHLWIGPRMAAASTADGSVVETRLERAGLELGTLSVDERAHLVSPQFFASLADLLALALYNRRLAEANQRLGILAERTRLAREIHDGLVQRFYALDLSLASAVMAMARPDGGSRALELIADAREQARTGVREGRQAIVELRREPPTGGLFPAVRLIADDFATRTGVECAVTVRGAEPVLSSAARMSLLRCVGELVLNVEKHAGARAAEIEVSVEGCRLELSVSDDGVGIGRAAAAAGHYGLTGVAERMEELGGEMRVVRRTGGTRIQLIVPDLRRQLTAGT